MYSFRLFTVLKITFTGKYLQGLGLAVLGRKDDSHLKTIGTVKYKNLIKIIKN